MEYTWKDRRYKREYDSQIAEMYQQGLKPYQIWITLDKALAKTTIYDKIRRINERYEHHIRKHGSEFD